MSPTIPEQLRGVAAGAQEQEGGDVNERITVRISGMTDHISFAVVVPHVPAVGDVLYGREVCHVDARCWDPATGLPRAEVLLRAKSETDTTDALRADVFKAVSP